MYVIEVPFLDLDQIYGSVQPLRWIKLRDSKYVIQNGQCALKVEQQRGRLIMSCTEEEFYEKWYNYFDMGTDYGDSYFGLCRKGDFLKACAVRNGGLRIIRQDLFECIIASIVYSTCGRSVAKFVLDSIAVGLGVEHIQGMREAGRIRWYEFPSPETILENIDKPVIPFVIRENVRNVCQDIVDGWFDLEDLKKMDESDVRDYLGEFGLRSSVIDLILVHGLGKLDVFPYDLEVDKAIAREFDYDDLETFIEWELDSFTNQKGIIYHRILNNELNPPRNMADELKVGAHRWG